MTEWTVPATVIRVIDGDTLVADLDCGWSITREAQHVRVAGINAPELHGATAAAGEAARRYAQTLLAPGLVVTVASQRLDDFGRTVGSVTLPDGRDFAGLMLAAGQAVVYDTGGGSAFPAPETGETR